MDKFVTYCRVKFYTQEIVFFRQDLLYRMRRSCLVPPSTEETDDHFEHVTISSIFPQTYIYLVDQSYSLSMVVYEANGFQFSVAACCYNNPSKSSLPTSSLSAAHYLEL